MIKKLLLFTLIFLLSFKVITDPDFGWHLRVGQFIVDTGSVPAKDIFSFSMPDYPYVFHSWASDLLIYLSYQAGSLIGVTIMFAAITTLSIFFLYKTTQLLSPINPPLLFMLLTSPIAYSIAGGRTRTFGLLFLSIIYFLFSKFQVQNSKYIYFIPLIFFLWVNFHGSFIVGIFALAILIIINFFFAKNREQKFKKTKTAAIILVASVVATLANPYGFRAWQQAISMGTTNYFQIKSINSDWLPLISTQNTGWIFGLFGLGIFILTLSPRVKIDISQKIFFLLFLALSLINSRFSIAFFVPFTTVAAQAIAQFGQKLNSSVAQALPVKTSLLVLIAAILLLAIQNLVEVKTAYRSFESYSKYLYLKFPKNLRYAAWSYESNKFVVENLRSSRILNDANWGGLMLLVSPNQKVFYYGAMDNYILDGKSFAFKFLDLVNAKPGFELELEKYLIDAVFLPKTYPIITALQQKAEWQTAYEDENTIVLVKL